jgi:hypothetical protein
MALPPTTTTSPYASGNLTQDALSSFGDRIDLRLLKCSHDEWAPLLRTFLTTQRDRLGGFSFADVAGFSPTPPHVEPPSHSEDLQASLAALAAEVRELRTLVSAPRAPPGAPPRQPSAKPKPNPTPKPPAPPRAPAKPASSPPSRPTFASVARAPARPSLVIRAAASQTSDGDAILVVKRSPQEVISYLNSALTTSPHPVTLSATWWTGKHNLVVTAGPNTTAHHLASSCLISDALTPFLSLDHSSPLPISITENVKWSRILINGIPTGVSDCRGPYSPSECHAVLVVDNPIYRTLHLMQSPSWVHKLDSYSPGSSSSLVLAFEDPNGSALWALLTGQSLYAFGHEGDIKRWKQHPHVKSQGAAATTPSL